MTKVLFQIGLVDSHGIEFLEHLLAEPRDIGLLDVLLYGLPGLVDHHVDEPARDHIEDAGVTKWVQVDERDLRELTNRPLKR